MALEDNIKDIMIQKYINKAQKVQRGIEDETHIEEQQRKNLDNPYFFDPHKGEFKRISLVLKYEEWEMIQAICGATAQPLNAWIRERIQQDLDDPANAEKYSIYLEMWRKRQATLREAAAKRDITTMAYWWEHYGIRLYDVGHTGAPDLKPYCGVKQDPIFGWIDVEETPGRVVRYERRSRWIQSSDHSYRIKYNDVVSDMRRNLGVKYTSEDPE